MNKKILLIDDEDLVVKSVSKLLAREGYDVLVCRNGNEALNVIKEGTVDLVICDIRMPDVNGIETIKMIRRHYESNGLKPPPEILMTGYAEDTANAEAEAMKVADYIYKPFDLRDFLKSVKKNIKGC